MKSEDDIMCGHDMQILRLELPGMNQAALAELMGKREDQISRMEEPGERDLDSDDSDMLRLVYDTCEDFRKKVGGDIVFNSSSPSWIALKATIHREAQTGSLRQGSRLRKSGHSVQK